MAFSFTRFLNGIRLLPKSVSTVSTLGDMDVTNDGKLNYFNGNDSSPMVTEAQPAALTNKTIDGSLNTLLNIPGSAIASNAAIPYSKLNLTDSIENSDINSNAAIAYSKLNLAGDIINSDINSAAAIAYSKLNLSNSIVNSDINASAAISVNKLAPLTANKAVITDGSGFISPSVVSASELAFVSGVTSNIQTQLNSKQSTLTLPLSIAQGGTGASTAVIAFNDLSPTTTKGDIIVDNGTNNVRFGVGTDNQVLTADSTQTNGLRWADNSGGSSSSSVSNFIINGNFDFWQRSTSAVAFNTGGNSVFAADRWGYVTIDEGIASVSILQSVNVPSYSQSHFKSVFSNEIQVAASNSSVSSLTVTFMRYTIEGYNYADIVNKTCTLNFWVYSSLPGTYCVAFQTHNRENSYISEYTINSGNTWEKKSITLTLTDAGSQQNYTNDIGLEIDFTLSCGSAFQNTPGSWIPGGGDFYFGTSNQINFNSSTSNLINFSQVSLTVGSNNVDFQRTGITIAQELILCQRYFEKSWDILSPVGTHTDNGLQTITLSNTPSTLGMSLDVIPFQVRKRTFEPTIVFYSALTLTTGHVFDDTSSMDVVAGVALSGDRCYGIGINAVDQDYCLWHWTADTEM